jgi:hypothetical protein
MEQTMTTKLKPGLITRLAVRAKAGQPISVVEIIITATAFLALWIGLALTAGGPLYSDELWYIHLGLNNLPAHNVLNRYFHIYLQKLFMELAPSPLVGVQAYWGFLISGTATLVYLAGRMFTRTNTPLHGLLGVVIFFTYRVLAEYSGITVVDTTAMLMVAVLVTLYIYIIRFASGSPWLIAWFGFIFFMALKTKETTLCCAPLLLGFGFDEDERFSLKQLARTLFYFGLGAVGGAVFFIALNTLILKNPLFGLTPSDFKMFSSALATTTDLNPQMSDWYLGYLLPTIPASFLLYVFSGVKIGRRVSPEQRLLWAVPLFLIAFLSVSMIRGDWGIRARHLLPILPVMSLLAPQFLYFGSINTARERLIHLAGLASSGLVFLVALFSLKLVMARGGWDITSFTLYVVFPVVFSGLIVLLVLFDRYPWYGLVAPLVCLGLIFYGPLQSNLKEVFLTRRTAEQFQHRIQPLEFIKPLFRPVEEMRFFISYGVAEHTGSPDANTDEMLSLVNFYYDASTRRENYAFGIFNEKSTPPLLSPVYDYALLTGREFDFLSGPDLLQVGGAYEIYTSAQREYILLVRK